MPAHVETPKTDKTGSSLLEAVRERCRPAIQKLRSIMFDDRNAAGYWVGQLSGSALATATALSTLSFYQKAIPSNRHAARINQQINQGFEWLVGQQNDDGGFGDTDLSHSNISTTMLVVAAIHAAGRKGQYQGLVDRAEKYIDEQGGIPALRKRYGKDKTFAVPILANCAMAGIVDWKEVSALPFEAACVPQRFYHWMRMPVVSYAVPALVAIGQIKFLNDPPWNPITRLVRKAGVNRSLDVLKRMQPASGGFLEAVPLTSFVSMALIESDRASHPVVKKGIQFILNSFREEGNWPIDTNLATWNTTLSINALSVNWSNNRLDWNRTLDWILKCQTKTVHPFTNAQPGGWGWTDLSGAVPDSDDTPGALLALANLRDHVELDDERADKVLKAGRAGVKWLLDLQNRDRGWPTFCRGWGRFPFDRSGADITAHVLRAFITWQNKFPGERIRKAIDSGFAFLDKCQRSDGSWEPLWFGNQDYSDDLNLYYGTAKVLLAYRDAKRFDTQAAQKGLNWIAENQNDDGGWGGGPSLERPDVGLGYSSVEETGLCLETLASSSNPEHLNCVLNGIEWLVTAVDNDLVLQSWPIGFYFAKLWYYEKQYPLIFATSALGSVMKSRLVRIGGNRPFNGK